MKDHDSVPDARTIGMIARMLGLKAGSEREERLHDEFVAALDAVDDLDAAIPQSAPGTAGTETFDAGWTKDSRQ